LGGFYISNKHETKLKEGSKFKKGDIVSINNSYFDVDTNEYVSGPLMKVMVNSGYYEYDDSNLIREGLGEKLTSHIIKKTRVILGPNANLEQIVNVGDEVQTGDVLITFEHSFDDKSANELLSKLGTEYEEQIAEMSKNTYKSHYSGKIDSIEIFYNVDWAELSPSLQRIINKINGPAKKREILLKKNLNQSELNEFLIAPTGQLENVDGKIKGVKVGNGVMIDIFLDYEDILSVGDKFVFNSALKSVTSKTVPDSLAPYTENNPEEPIDCILSTYSVLNRLTADLPLNLYGNKVLVELKKSIKKIWES